MNNQQRIILNEYNGIMAAGNGKIDYLLIRKNVGSGIIGEKLKTFKKGTKINLRDFDVVIEFYEKESIKQFIRMFKKMLKRRK